MSQKISAKQAKTSQMSRGDFTELFVDVLKICRPEHPYRNERAYDQVSKQDVVEGYCRSDSSFCARCGPRARPNIAIYAIDLSYFQDHTIEHILAITIHEVTHIEIGRHSQSGKSPSHPPEFWNTMAFHAQKVLDNISQIEEKWGEINYSKLRSEIAEDPNCSMVDRRTESVSEVRSRIMSWVGDYPTNTP